MPTARRTRRVPDSTIWSAALVALIVHVGILGTVHAFGVSLVGDGLTRGGAPRLVAEEDVDLKPTCTGDAVFAMSGRTAMCFAPWISDVDQCLSDAQMYMWMELSSCEARNDPGTAIAMVEQKTAEKLTPIDPERLLEEMRPTPRPVAPPPPQIAQAQPAAPPPPPPPPEVRRPAQIIETVKPKEEQPEPENSRFLSEYNTKVDKQTVARGAANEPMVAESKPKELTPKDKPKDEPSVKQEQDRVPGRNERAPDVPGHLSMRTPGAQSPAEREQEAKTRGSANGAVGDMTSDGYAQRKGDAALEQQRRDRSEIPRGQNGAGGGAPPVPNLKPTEEVLERALGGGSVDHLEDVENGDQTALNSTRFIYATFFNRLKRQVAQNWDPATVYRRRDPTGTVYGFKTRVTEVRVSLSRKGELTKILVTTPSGVIELDDEAVRAFKSAGPFPNPPEGLVTKDNQITFAFSFFFEIGTPHITWRVPHAM